MSYLHIYIPTSITHLQSDCGVVRLTAPGSSLQYRGVRKSGWDGKEPVKAVKGAQYETSTFTFPP